MRITKLILFYLVLSSSKILAQEDPVMTVQLPFPDRKAYRCTQNSGDTPTHNGNSTRFDLDFAMEIGTLVVAAEAGTVDRVDSSCWGRHIKINHGNYYTIYAHLSNFIANEGDHVERGQPIAYSGNDDGGNSECSSGPHLHFGVHEGNYSSQPMRVYGKNLTTNETDFFDTSSDIENSDFVCDPAPGVRTGHVYQALDLPGSSFSEYSCVALPLEYQGILCWEDNPTTCEDGVNHIRYYPGGTQSENAWEWCSNAASGFGFIDPIAYLESLPGGVGGDPDTTPIGPDPDPLSGDHSDLRPDFDIFHEDGHEISANCSDCSTEPVYAGQLVETSLRVQVENNDAANSLRDPDSDSIDIIGNQCLR